MLFGPVFSCGQCAADMKALIKKFWRCNQDAHVSFIGPACCLRRPNHCPSTWLFVPRRMGRSPRLLPPQKARLSPRSTNRCQKSPRRRCLLPSSRGRSGSGPRPLLPQSRAQLLWCALGRRACASEWRSPALRFVCSVDSGMLHSPIHSLYFAGSSRGALLLPGAPPVAPWTGAF